jgi:hypothetical protein
MSPDQVSGDMSSIVTSSPLATLQSSSDAGLSTLFREGDMGVFNSKSKQSS